VHPGVLLDLSLVAAAGLVVVVAVAVAVACELNEGSYSLSLPPGHLTGSRRHWVITFLAATEVLHTLVAPLNEICSC
jgi:hypothetical protein